MSEDRVPVVEYDLAYGIATFDGPGGFTQQRMSQTEASAIAYALGIHYVTRNSNEL